MNPILPYLLVTVIPLVAGRTVSTPTMPLPTPIMPPSTPTAVPKALAAGFRFSTYGPSYDPGAEYLAGVGQQMAAKFPNAKPQAIWIVGNYAGAGPLLTFPGSHKNVNIHFSLKDKNEEALTLFDQRGVQV